MIGRVDRLGIDLGRRNVLDLAGSRDRVDIRNTRDVHGNLCVLGHVVDLIEIEGIEADEVLCRSPTASRSMGTTSEWAPQP